MILGPDMEGAKRRVFVYLLSGCEGFGGRFGHVV